MKSSHGLAIRGAFAFALSGCMSADAPLEAGDGEPAQQTQPLHVAPELTVYVGSHDARIDVLGLGRLDGKLSARSSVIGDAVNLLDHPSFLHFDARHRRLFAVSENYFDPTPFQSALAAFSSDPASGALTFLNAEPTGFSFDPFQFTLGAVHLTTDRRGEHLIVAIFGGYVQTWQIEADGQLGAKISDLAVCDSPHQVVLDTDEDTLLVPCLGSDEVRLLDYDSDTGELALRDQGAIAVPDGAGPRHLAFDVTQRFVYLVNEKAATVNVYRYRDDTLEATPIQTLSTLPTEPGDFDRVRAAEVVVSPYFVSGLLYVSTRLDGLLEDGSYEALPGWLTTYRIHPVTRTLTPIAATQVGKEPRHFDVDPSGRFVVVANKESDSVVAYRANKLSGTLTEVSSLAVPHPDYAGIVDR